MQIQRCNKLKSAHNKLTTYHIYTHMYICTYILVQIPCPSVHFELSSDYIDDKLCIYSYGHGYIQRCSKLVSAITEEVHRLHVHLHLQIDYKSKNKKGIWMYVCIYACACI